MKTKLIFLLILLSFSLSAQTIYVDQNATGSNDGTDWTNAYTDLQVAFTHNGAFSSINVAQGTYYPTTTTDRTISFIVPSGIKLYGGFPTGGGAKNSDIYPTILSGDIGIIGDKTDNSYHVVFFQNTISSTELDGFTIEKGYANGTGSNESNGGGILILTVDYGNSNAYIKNCIIRNNYAVGDGGGIFVYKRAEIYNCKIYSNQTANSGGGISISTNGRIYNSYIVNNKSVHFGGGIKITGFNSAPKAINCIIANNECEYYGAGAYLTEGYLINCTIVNNGGNGIHFGSYGSTFNGIIWGNSTYQATHIATNNGHSVENNIIQDISASGTNIGISSNNNGVNYNENYVRFIKPTTFTGNSTTPAQLDEILNANWSINPQSAAIDFGDNNSYTKTTDTPTVDINGNNRILNTTMDAGAYEALFNIVTTQASNHSETAVTLNGEMLFAETENTIKRGFVYDNVPNFDVTSATIITNSNTGIGIYSDNITGLTQDQYYYFKAWAEIDGVKHYANEMKFNTSNLVAYYPFNGNANDDSGNNLNGTVNGATLSLDRFSNPESAYSFDGNDIITIAHNDLLNSNNELSFSVWVKPTAQQDAMILGKSNYTSTTNYLLRIKSTGFIQFEYKDFANTNSLPLSIDNWNHIAVVSNTDNSKMVYINGELATHTSAFSPYGLVNNTLTIGARSGAEFFNGIIDDLRIYNAALTESDILNLYNNFSLDIKDNPNFKDNDCYVFMNNLYFKNDQNSSKIESFSIYNLLGQNIYQDNNIKNKVSLNFLKQGIYILKTEKNNNKTTIKKFIIQ